MKSILTFLKALKKNNRREWFEKHRDEFDAARLKFEHLVFDLTEAVRQFDRAIGQPEPRDCIFRIYRDVRFSKDKSPYKCHFGAVVGAKGRKTTGPLYYVHLEPGDCFAGGGVYQPDAPYLQTLRRYVVAHGNECRSILQKPSFAKMFDGLWDQRLQRPPKGFDPDDPHIELAKYKSYIVSHRFTEAEVTGRPFLKRLTDAFRELRQFNQFLRKA